jgi:NAD(P)-dependent dehydrogenase (short-subunit alcohol dehydrogenase family)
MRFFCSAFAMLVSVASSERVTCSDLRSAHRGASCCGKNGTLQPELDTLPAWLDGYKTDYSGTQFAHMCRPYDAPTPTALLKDYLKTCDELVILTSIYQHFLSRYPTDDEVHSWMTLPCTASGNGDCTACFKKSPIQIEEELFENTEWMHRMQLGYKKDLTGKTAIVSGMSSGFGFQIAVRLAQLGAQVFGGARQKKFYDWSVAAAISDGDALWNEKRATGTKEELKSAMGWMDNDVPSDLELPDGKWMMPQTHAPYYFGMYNVNPALFDPADTSVAGNVFWHDLDVRSKSSTITFMAWVANHAHGPTLHGKNYTDIVIINAGFNSIGDQTNTPHKYKTKEGGLAAENKLFYRDGRDGVGWATMEETATLSPNREVAAAQDWANENIMYTQYIGGHVMFQDAVFAQWGTMNSYRNTVFNSVGSFASVVNGASQGRKGFNMAEYYNAKRSQQRLIDNMQTEGFHAGSVGPTYSRTSFTTDSVSNRRFCGDMLNMLLGLHNSTKVGRYGIGNQVGAQTCESVVPYSTSSGATKTYGGKLFYPYTNWDIYAKAMTLGILPGMVMRTSPSFLAASHVAVTLNLMDTKDGTCAMNPNPACKDGRKSYLLVATPSSAAPYFYPFHFGGTHAAKGGANFPTKCGSDNYPTYWVDHKAKYTDVYGAFADQSPKEQYPPTLNTAAA